MKKIVILVFFIGLYHLSNAQNDVKQIVRTQNDLKTGNLLDVLTNFSQLAITDLYGTNRSFSFKSTLFGIMVKTDPDLNIDRNFVKYKNARNLQFNLSGKLDQSYKFNGLSLGFTFAIKNKRDKALFTIYQYDNSSSSAYQRYNGGEEMKKDNKVIPISTQLFDSYNNLLDIANAHYLDRELYLLKPKSSNKDSIALYSKDTSQYSKYKKKIEAMYASGKFYRDSLPFWAKKSISQIDINSANKFFMSYLEALNSYSLKPLWTISASSEFDANGLFKQGKGEMVYLVGLWKTQYTCQLDARANFAARDSITASIPRGFYRKIVGASIGINFQLLKGKESKKSILEFKPYFEYLNNMDYKKLGETHETTLANAELRLRVMDDLWIPVTIKYDTKTSNVFGFLNISYNLDAFKPKSKS